MLAWCAGVAPRAAYAQAERPVHWTAIAPRRAVAPNDTVRIILKGSIDEFFHMYSTTQGPGGPVRTEVELLSSADWTRGGALRVPSPDTIPDGNFGIMSEVYSDSVAFGLTLRRLAATRIQPELPRVAVRFQVCTTRYCLPARTDTVIVPVVLSTASTAASALAAVPPPSSPSPTLSVGPVADSAVRALSDASTPSIATYGGANGAGAFLLLAASMGMLALLTPCVLPMIPITVTSFLAVGDDRRRGIGQAGLYAAGIIGTFTVLGVATAVVFGASGLARFSAHPVVNLAIAALFVFFALSLLGATTLRLPSSVATRIASIGRGGGAAGPLLMGGVFTITAFTCTAPFVGTLLVLSSQGNWRWPLAGMLVFASVFAAPFFLLALVPGMLRKRLRPGSWMRALEMVLGAIEIAAAVKFVSNADMVLGWGVFTRAVVIGLWIVIFAILAIALFWRKRGEPMEHTRRGAFRVAALVSAIVLVALLVPGLRGRSLGELEAFLPPVGGGGSIGANSSAAGWVLNDYRAALVAANREQRPILIDFTGYTCTNCRWMEANMFPRDDVQRAFDRFVRVRLYTDGIGEPYTSQQRLEEKLFGTVALPLYAVVDASGRPRARFLGMTRNASEFVDFLTRAASAPRD
jgi:thiol:disulfide interchange protein DsbD